MEKAGLKPDAISVRAEGFDRGTPSEQASQGITETPEEINYDKCLPMEKALDPDTIVAWALNGEYLRHVHGAPVRLVVPGWSGNWSVKWLHKLEVLDHMAPCWYQTHYFYYSDSVEDENREMVTTMGVRSLITDPRDGDPALPRGVHMVRGLAWSGCGSITRLEVSVDGGDIWHDACLEEPRGRWLWVRWHYAWDVQTSGTFNIKSRATDEMGRVQPQIRWNYLRKNFDGIVPVEVKIE
jgi:DMSO/TMAO reductase YedYZ molybdopterin-dependent catalytic subunit